ncbi:MAG: hypothetical protein KAQ85_03165, partial [Thermodesulfovibrionia bacterium]|nr:hypothetical protein [Thermodesulfovibrionia bacterium]
MNRSSYHYIKQKEPEENNNSRNFVILPLLLLLIGLAIYYPTINCRYFFFDDKTVIESNSIRGLDDIQKIYRGFNTRFIAGVSYVLNYTFSKNNPFGYYLTNVLLHITNAYLLFVLIRLLLSFESSWHKPRPLVNSQTFAFLVAVLFLTHPVQTDAVNYISQRTIILTVMFYIMTMIFYLRYSKTGRQKFQIFGVLSAITAMFCKEIAITLPIMLLLLEI